MTLIEPTLNRYLAHVNEERLPDGRWHPSSLFQCDRKAVYEVRGTEETDPKPDENLRPLAMGKLIHELLQATMTHATKTGAIKAVWHEVEVTIPPLNITGHADSLVELVQQDWTEFEVEEFKSIKSIAIKYAKPRFSPKPEHIGQALTYVYGMRYFPYVTVDADGVETTHPPLGGKLRSARVTYWGKDASDIHEFLFDITPEWEVSLLEYIADLEKYRADGEALPPRMAGDMGKRYWLCDYCPFRTRCWQTDGEGVEL